MKSLLVVIASLFITGCEIIETDITSKRVALVAPAHHTILTEGNVSFHWIAMEHAIGYEFVVSSPSFQEAEWFAIDTVLYADSLTRRFTCKVTLPKGIYEWSVCGFNNGYASTPEVRSLTIVNE